jgi:hypothetical protein
VQLDKADIRPWGWALVLSLLLTGGLVLRTGLMTTDHPDFPMPWDHHKYLWMAAENPLGFHIAPFCWRVLVPCLARSLPFGLQWSFLLIAFAGVSMTGAIIYSLARELFAASSFGFIAMLMYFSLGWAGKFALHDFWLPDAVSFLFIALGIHAILTRRDALFVLTLALGVLVKESVIFVAPLYYTLRTSRLVDPGLFKRCVLLTLPAIVVLISVRALIPSLNNDPGYLSTLPATARMVQDGVSSYDYVDLFTSIGLRRLRDLSVDDLYSYTIGTFGAVLLLPLFAWRRSGVLFLRFLPFLALVYAQLLFAVNDERLLVAAFPAVILMALAGVDALVVKLSIRPAWLTPVFFLFVGLDMVAESFFSIAQLTVELLVLLAGLALCFNVEDRAPAATRAPRLARRPGGAYTPAPCVQRCARSSSPPSRPPASPP